jgi:hypothetical protein
MHIDDKPTYRMSSAGYCPRRLGCIQLGLESESAPKWLETSAEEGNWHEKRIKDELVEQGYQVFDEQLELVIDQDTFQLIGHIDGKVRDNNKVVQLLEIKSMSRFEFDRWMKGRFAEFPQYASQLACYFAGTGLSECLYIVKNRESGYKDRQVVSSEDFPIQPIIDKIAMVQELAHETTLVEMEFDSDKIECKRCQFKKLCIPHEIPRDAVTDANLRRAVAMIRQGKELEQSGKDLYDEGKAILKQHTYAIGKKKWEFEQVIVSLIQVKDTVTYPKEAIEEKVPEHIRQEIAVAKPGYEYLKIVDLEKNND